MRGTGCGIILHGASSTTARATVPRKAVGAKFGRPPPRSAPASGPGPTVQRGLALAGPGPSLRRNAAAPGRAAFQVAATADPAAPRIRVAREPPAGRLMVTGGSTGTEPSRSVDSDSTARPESPARRLRVGDQWPLSPCGRALARGRARPVRGERPDCRSAEREDSESRRLVALLAFALRNRSDVSQPFRILSQENAQGCSSTRLDCLVCFQKYRPARSDHGFLPGEGNRCSAVPFLV